MAPMESQAVKIFAPVKVNLFLHINGKRNDGYHTLQSIFSFGDVGDEITLTPSEQLHFTIRSNNQTLKADDNNLVIKAVTAVCDYFKQAPDFQIELVKNIPLGGGLGGGSADAAAAVKAILKYWHKEIPEEDLNPLLLQLGADVPACYQHKACLVEGVGEKITPLDYHLRLPAVLAFPGESCSTAEVFTNYKAGFKPRLNMPDTDENFIGFIKQQHNDLTDTACAITPVIQDSLSMLSAQSGCELARVSGSGSSCFGIFDSAENAKVAAAFIQKEKPDWWVRPVTLQ